MEVVAIILGIIFGLGFIGFLINRLFFANELKAIAPYGRLVEVDGRMMHVYSMGSGGKTIVLLPGFGVSLPSADFGPLMRELAKEHTVVCVEYFGIGFSDQVGTPRTNANYVEETRAALSRAGFRAPYVLMPHSSSGIHCEYYAARYPDEVSAIVMLDTTSTARAKGANPPRFVYGIAKAQQACGLTRLALSLAPAPQKPENGYAAKEIADSKLFTCHVLNDTIIDQSLRMLDNINEVSELPFPQGIRVLKLIASQTKKRVGDEYQAKHLNRIGSQVESQVIDGSHFIYQTRVAEIVAATEAFLSKVS